MAEVILMPRLSDTMTEGVIAAWHKKVGDQVKKGDLLAEVETDKATMELESYKDGVLLHLGGNKGSKIQVNGLLAIIGNENEDISYLLNTPVAAAPVPSSTTSSAPAATTTNSPAPSSTLDLSKMDEVVLMPRLSDTMEVGVIAGTSAPTTATAQTATSSSASVISSPVIAADATTATPNGRIKASPLAKKIAQDKGVDLSSLHGSGDGGRIIKADLDNVQMGGQPTTIASVAPAYAGQTKEGYTDTPNSQMRGVIARRLAESKFSAPHFYLKMEINMDQAIAARTQLNEVSPVKVSFNDFVIKAVALALRQHPAVNASWLGDKIRRYHHVHVGVAVALEDGLIVPVVRFADNKTLPQIAAEAKELAAKAKSKKLQPNEFTGNTFTISNLGMMDIDEFTAIINPPDSCMLAVGRISEKVIRKTDGFAVTQVMKVTLSCDHRSVDGASGAAFLQTVKKFLENPIQLFL
ncbi:MAG: pyruvate dehydrogenase complex dihydrolipoamide acetyltransferase [Bacteroidetes bacterium]|nr:pyruvate dehydrogenase complex dihydrolipoamide acetyltransferase [Bacteroidota bacterium]